MEVNGAVTIQNTSEKTRTTEREKNERRERRWPPIRAERTASAAQRALVCTLQTLQIDKAGTRDRGMRQLPNTLVLVHIRVAVAGGERG